MPTSQRHILHIYPTFEVGGAQMRLSRVINHFGDRFRHTIVSLGGDLRCRENIDKSLSVSYLSGPAQAKGLLARLQAYRRMSRDLAPDVLITNNWGSIEWALAGGLCRGFKRVHYESGFGPDEVEATLTRRNWLRRLALLRAASLVMPSVTLQKIALNEWRIPDRKVAVIRDGIDCAAFRDAAPGHLSGFDRKAGEIVIGTVAILRPEKNLARLIRCFSGFANDFEGRLVIAGDGKERDLLTAAAEESGLGERVVFTGFLAEPEKSYPNFDIFALSSDTEQTPNAVLQAMAAGLPVAALDVGDLRSMLSPENADLVVTQGDEDGFSNLLQRLASDSELRSKLGDANRQKVFAEYDEAQMFAAYEGLFGEALE